MPRLNPTTRAVGEFANGAVTAAFARAFNEELEISPRTARSRLAAITKEFNEKIAGMEDMRWGSADQAATVFADIAQPLTTRYQAELGANILKDKFGYYLTDFTVNSRFDPHSGVGIEVDIPLPSSLGVAYVHTHPGYSSFSRNDIAFGVSGKYDAYVSLPNKALYRFSYNNYVDAGSPDFWTYEATRDSRYVHQLRQGSFK